MVRFAWMLLLPLGGCFWTEAFRPLAAASSDWYEVGPVRKPLKEVMEAAQFYLLRSGYFIPRWNPADRGFETDWDTNLSSHWREGFRTKVEVKFPEQPDGSTLIRIRSYREFNDDPRFPAMADKAKWLGASTEDKQAPLIPEPAIKLRQHLKVRFFGLAND